MKTLGVIPARLNSSRLPRKALEMIGDRPMIIHVYERCLASGLDRVVVATDSEEIADVVEKAGGQCMLTSAEHTSGSARAAEVAAAMPEFDHVMNIQGDEVFIEPELIDALINSKAEHPNWHVLTAVFEISDAGAVNDTALVKAVLAADNRVLYFSRLPVPFVRDSAPPGLVYWGHIGLYLFERQALLDFAAWPQSMLEQAESLEQLRLLENGRVIGAVKWPNASFGVDTPADLERARQMYSA